MAAAGRRADLELLADRAAHRRVGPDRDHHMAVLDGDEYVINGHKWFASKAAVADFVLAMVVTNPEGGPYERASMIVIERGHARA